MILFSKFSLCNVLIFKGCFTFVVALWHFPNCLLLTCLRGQKERKKVSHTQIFFYGNKFCVTHTHTHTHTHIYIYIYVFFMKVVVQAYYGYCDRSRHGDWVCYGTPYGTTGIDCDFTARDREMAQNKN